MPLFLALCNKLGALVTKAFILVCCHIVHSVQCPPLGHEALDSSLKGFLVLKKSKSLALQKAKKTFAHREARR